MFMTRGGGGDFVLNLYSSNKLHTMIWNGLIAHPQQRNEHTKKKYRSYYVGGKLNTGHEGQSLEKKVV